MVQSRKRDFGDDVSKSVTTTVYVKRLFFDFACHKTQKR